MRSKSFWIGLGLTVMLTAGGTLVHGRFSNRWGPPQAMLDAGAGLQRIPGQIDGWDQGPAEPLSETTRAILECAGDISRSYVNPTTGAGVNLSIILGPAGPTSAHSPEICFPARNFRQLGERKRVTLRDASGVDHELWMVDFRAQDLEARVLHVYYAWSTGGAWSAPDNPRLSLAGSPYLYKLQIVGYPSRMATRSSEDPVPAFLSTFLPQAGSGLKQAPVTR